MFAAQDLKNTHFGLQMSQRAADTARQNSECTGHVVPVSDGPLKLRLGR